MTYNLKKIAVGIVSIDRLHIRQIMIKSSYGKIIHTTRNMPKQKDDLIDNKYLLLQRGKKNYFIILVN